ncbi:MAG: DMT family transporter [Nitriliruptoraceae bacterium]
MFESLPVRIAFTAAVIAGILIAVQSAILGAFGARLHPFVAATWVHVGGLVFGVVGVLIGRFGFHLEVVKSAPWGLLAGVAGVLLVTGIAIAVGGIGLASTLATVTAVQLLVGFGIETFQVADRALSLDPLRLLGGAMIVVGVYLVVSRGPSVA